MNMFVAPRGRKISSMYFYDSPTINIGDGTQVFCQFLSTLFCALRSCGVICWSWFYIMLPLFIYYIVLATSVVGLVIYNAYLKRRWDGSKKS